MTVQFLRFHEIAETNHRILNPFSKKQYKLLGKLCELKEGTSILDLACGKGEMLATWSKKHGITGTGVDISDVFLDAANDRAKELGVNEKVTFENADAGQYPQESHQFDIVSCIGATWIGGGFAGTVKLMKKALKDEKEGLLLIGEPFWHEEPTDEVRQAAGEGYEGDLFVTLAEMPQRFEECGLQLIEMVIANIDGWDRYEAPQWASIYKWLQENPDDPDADEMTNWIDNNQKVYLQHLRRYFGWGVFVLKVKS
jgi:SAM-dependent methyltransferase